MKSCHPDGVRFKAYRVECPYCHASPGRSCRVPKDCWGRPQPKDEGVNANPHFARLRACGLHAPSSAPELDQQPKS